MSHKFVLDTGGVEQTDRKANSPPLSRRGICLPVRFTSRVQHQLVGKAKGSRKNNAECGSGGSDQCSIPNAQFSSERRSAILSCIIWQSDIHFGRELSIGN